MPSIEARIDTDRPNRYLSQLCRHASAMDTMSGHRIRGHADAPRSPDATLTVVAECSDHTGILTFNRGARCIINAAANLLTLRIDADSEQVLNQVRDVITRDLERFGRRDGLIVTWA
jgi:hypothetical protein